MENLQGEIWKPIIYKGVDYTGIYEVSNMGRVMSFKYQLKLLKPTKKTTGYTCVSLGIKKANIHSLVVDAFLTNRQNGFVIDHINNIRSDNRLVNLQIITHRANISKQVTKDSLMPCGVYKCKSRIITQIRIGNLLFKFGSYKSIDTASQAYKIALSTHDQGKPLSEVFKAVDNYRESINLKPIKRRK